LEKALENNADDGEALGQLADIDYVYGWDWPRAEREFRLAMEHGGQYNTHSYYGWCLATRGRFAEAHRQLEIAQDLNPLGPRFNQAMTYLLEHRFEDAKRILHESIESKTGVLDSHLMLGVAAMYQKDCQEASAQFDWFAKQYPSPVADFGLAFAAACNGQLDEARQYIARAEGRKGRVSPRPIRRRWREHGWGIKTRRSRSWRSRPSHAKGRFYTLSTSRHSTVFGTTRGSWRWKRRWG
jgi:Tfp pilus assembly protein PilF